MPYYRFEETIGYLSEKIKVTPPQEDLDLGEVELVVDQMYILLAEGKSEGSLHMSLTLGLLLFPSREEHLRELVTSNYLGIKTGGCRLAFDETGSILSLHNTISPGSSLQESWEWLHRLVCVAREWQRLLVRWEEFVPLFKTLEES